MLGPVFRSQQMQRPSKMPEKPCGQVLLPLHPLLYGQLQVRIQLPLLPLNQAPSRQARTCQGRLQKTLFRKFLPPRKQMQIFAQFAVRGLRVQLYGKVQVPTLGVPFFARQKGGREHPLFFQPDVGVQERPLREQAQQRQHHKVHFLLRTHLIMNQNILILKQSFFPLKPPIISYPSSKRITHSSSTSFLFIPEHLFQLLQSNCHHLHLFCLLLMLLSQMPHLPQQLLVLSLHVPQVFQLLFLAALKQFQLFYFQLVLFELFIAVLSTLLFLVRIYDAFHSCAVINLFFGKGFKSFYFLFFGLQNLSKVIFKLFFPILIQGSFLLYVNLDPCQPRMGQYSSYRQPVLWLEHKYFRDDILARDAQLCRQVIIQIGYILFDAVLAEVITFEELIRKRARSCAQLVYEHSKAPDVDSIVVEVQLVDHLRRQIVQSPAICLSFVLAVIEARPSEVCQFEFVVGSYQYIFRLDVPVDDVQTVDVLERTGDLSDVPCGNCLFQFFVGRFEHGFIKLALFCELEDKVDGELVFKMIVKLDDVRIIQTVHYFYFVSHILYHFLIADGLFLNLLDRVNSARLFVFGLPNYTVAALAQDADILEIRPKGLVLPARLHRRRQEHDPIGYFIHLNGVIIAQNIQYIYCANYTALIETQVQHITFISLLLEHIYSKLLPFI